MYLNDILIFLKTHEEYEEYVYKVLQALEDINLLIELKKC
jgi:hypothetical protein